MRTTIILIVMIVFATFLMWQAKKESVVFESTKSNTIQQDLTCSEQVCLELKNLNVANRSFEIYMTNSVPVFGFQCDLPGLEIVGASGGLLEEYEYQTSNSKSRVLSFSMQAKPIPVGMGILTEVHYDNPEDVVCMTKIIFAGIL